MTPRRDSHWRVAIALGAACLTTIALAGCGGGHTTTHRQGLAATTGGRTMHFTLASDTTGTVTAQVPAQPLGTTPTTFPGVTLQVYTAKRIGSNAVLVVFAFELTGQAPSVTLEGGIAQSLDANYGVHPNGNGPTGDVDAVSAVSLFDPVGLKEYLPYMADPSNDATCLCSNMNGAPFDQDGTVYLAAVVAAPPAGRTVSFVTGVGTVTGITVN
jgi:hypothetical protein